MGADAPPELLGMHSNMPGTVPPEVSRTLASNVLGAGDPPPSGLSADEARAYEQLSFHFAAWQEPNLFTTEVRAAFRSLREEGRSS
jgi:hypothetical protein